MTNKVDVTSLHAAVDQRRQSQDLSWRQLAKELEISPSTLSRMAQGHKPDVNSFATIIDWLGVPAEQFFRSDASAERVEPDTLAMVSSHLRANKKLTNENAKALEQIIRAAFDALKVPDDDGDHCATAEVERARERERAGVVAFLRARATAEHPIERGVPALSPAGRGLLLLMASSIEAGEHRGDADRG